MLATRALARLLGGAGGAAPWAAFSTKVRVPPLGDSISEGSISAVLKQAGDLVQENDVIAQIETDKVTIDIKSPQAGTLLGILVKVEDTVTPGQLIATVDESAAPSGALFGGRPAAAAADAAAAAPAPAPAAAAAARRPGISFPPRATPDGQRISALPAPDAAAWVQRLAGGGGGGGAAPHAAAAPAAAEAAAAATATAAAAHHLPPAPPVSAAAAAVGKTAKAKVVTTRLKEQPERMKLTDKELEAIMLGGAMD